MWNLSAVTFSNRMMFWKAKGLQQGKGKVVVVVVCCPLHLQEREREREWSEACTTADNSSSLHSAKRHWLSLPLSFSFFSRLERGFVRSFLVSDKTRATSSLFLAPISLSPSLSLAPVSPSLFLDPFSLLLLSFSYFRYYLLTLYFSFYLSFAPFTFLSLSLIHLSLSLSLSFAP